MAIEANPNDIPDNEQGDSDGDLDGMDLTPEQLENMRRALARLEQTMISNIDLSKLTMPESLIESVANAAGLMAAQRDRLQAMTQPLIEANKRVHQQMASFVSTEALRNIAAAQANFVAYTDQLTRNIDFVGIAAKIAETFAQQQWALFANLGPAMEAMRANFYPPNLRGIAGLKIGAVNEVVMTDGIPLYGLPRASVAEALTRATDARERRDILARRWKTISADCREVVTDCVSDAVSQYAPVALAALDALDAGHAAPAQALAGSLIDAIVTDYFGSDRYKYTPNKKNPTTAAYDEFTIREFIAFAPMWQAYQQFFASNGDKVPATFSRNATAHTVSRRQFSRRNAVQGLMLVCSLLYRIEEEASAASSRD
ncbi:hypothetical protein B7495_06135 [Cryobacterium sp. LW097]|uniref:hypothetical protein n=1 Tax=Cryobacterium sp. LW097 TaxID=1978566 RepID=UPI000B4CB81B|nr:hypothetical protein [Cryobacterium sp. LW097]ASD21726.1 hypothetical protein B7495_06135 [Cryobacterium sp. LW097]